MAGARWHPLSGTGPRRRDDVRRDHDTDLVTPDQNLNATIDTLLDTLRFRGADEHVALDWSSLDVRGLGELVLHEGAAIWLFRRLRALQLLHDIPADLNSTLRQRALEHSALRLQVEAEAGTVVDLLTRAAIPVVLLKGVARCALAERYPYLDARGTSDVDVLVPPDMPDPAVAALMRHGYTSADPDGPARMAHHHRPGLRRDSVSVEIHSSISTRVPPEVAWQRAHDSAQAVDWQGRHVLVPRETELAWHAIAHAMEDELDGFRLARLLELASLIAGGAPIDWDVIHARARSAEACDAALIPDEPERVVQHWISAAQQLVSETIASRTAPVDEFDLAQLLTWRLRVLRARRRLGRAAAERLLEEGGRAMTGLPRQPAPPHTLWYARARRNLAGRGSRLVHHLWRSAYTH